MTTATTRSPSDLRKQARQVYRESVAAGAAMSGKALGERFGRSERWGRERIAEIRPTLPPPDWCHANGGNGNGSVGAAAASTSPRQPHGTNTTAAATAVSPPGARFVAWLGFVFGSVMSVAANVLHAWLPTDGLPAGWAPSVAQQVGSAVWPIGLLLSVEVLSRVHWTPGFWWALAHYGGAGAVAVGSAVISYGHLHEVLIAWDYGPLGAAVGPLVLDGLMVVSGFALLAMSHSHEAIKGSEISVSVTGSVTAPVPGCGRDGCGWCRCLSTIQTATMRTGTLAVTICVVMTCRPSRSRLCRPSRTGRRQRAQCRCGRCRQAQRRPGRCRQGRRVRCTRA